MRRLLAGVVALLLAATYLTSAVLAQSGASVRQSGNVTPNTVPYWVTSGVIAGNVNAADSPVSSFGVTQSGSQGVCANSARVSSGSWQSMCLGYVSGQPTITVQNNGSAPTQSLQFIVNGTTYPFPGALAGLTIGSTPVTGGINNDCLTVGGSVLNQTDCTLLTLGTTGTGSIVLNGSPTLSGTIAGNLTWSGTQLWSAGVTAGSSLISTGTATPASAAGNTVVMGTISAPPLANAGQAYLFNTVVGGAILQGDGSTSDITLVNKSGSAVLSVPTGTTGVTLPGVPIFSGLSSGTCSNSLALDSGNHVVTAACPGAASSIQVGTTTISSGTTANILYNNGGTLGNETIASILTAGAGISITGTTNASIALTAARQTLPTISLVTTGAHSGGFAANGSGTYTTPSNVLWLEVEIVGGGAGGTGGAGAGGAAGASCWNTTGAACSTPVYSAGGGSGVSGGTIAGSSTCTVAALTGGNGQGGVSTTASTSSAGGIGGSTPLGGAGAGVAAAGGGAAVADTGSGGAGGGVGSTVQNTGAGGGAGATCRVLITSPAATYTYVVGTKSTGGGAGSNISAGGNGADGRITVIEHYGS